MSNRRSECVCTNVFSHTVKKESSLHQFYPKLCCLSQLLASWLHRRETLIDVMTKMAGLKSELQLSEL